MTRKEEREYASVGYTMSTRPRAICGDVFGDMMYKMNINPAFIAGAKWADKTILEKLRNFIAHHTDIKDVYNFLKNIEE